VQNLALHPNQWHQCVDIHAARLAGDTVQSEDYFLIQTAMMFLRALFLTVDATLLDYYSE
jgi:hypothetical protein